MSTEHLERVEVLPERHDREYRLGRHIEHDERSRAFRAVVARRKPTTSRLWHRVSVFDQGALGSCTGNAVVGVAASSPYRKTGIRYGEALAVAVYKRATVLDEFPGSYKPDDTGSSGLSACKAAVERKLAGSFLWAFGVVELAVGVVEVGPYAVGTDWTDGMFEPDERGVVHPSGGLAGGHEYEVIGFDADADEFICVNSWSRSWGLNGRFRIAYDDMGDLLNRGGDCVTLAA